MNVKKMVNNLPLEQFKFKNKNTERDRL